MDRTSKGVGWLAVVVGLIVAVLGVGAAGFAWVSLDRTPPVIAPVAAKPADVDAPTEAAPVAAGGDVAHVARTWGDSVYKVTSTGCGGVATGSAWVLDTDLVVTNWHVVTSDTTPTVTSRDGIELSAEVVGWSRQPDIAVLKVDGALGEPLGWADTAGLEEGQELVGMGYPAPGGDFTVTPSTVLSFQMSGSTRQAIRTDGQLDKGNSGGPAVTLDGQVAGVVTEMALNSSGLQLVPLLFTPDALESTVVDIISNPEAVSTDCDADRPSLPDDWDESWDYQNADAPFEYGDDAELDALVDGCVDGDMDACDSLYWSSDFGTDYEEMAMSCGGTQEWAFGTCARDAADQAAIGALAAQCEGGDMQACDDLSWDAPYGSAEYAIAQECGGHYPSGWGDCVSRAADAADDERAAASLAQLVSACEGGDMQACDDLSWEASYGSSEYEIAQTCGGHYPDGWADCVDREVDAAEQVELRDACAAGDMEACDDLWWLAPSGSDDEEFASTCGNRTEPSYGTCALTNP